MRPQYCCPVELWEHVLDHVPWLPGFAGSSIQTRDFQLQRRTLHACTLVCRAWTPRTQFLLWHNVLLDTKLSVSAFLATVRDAPDRWAPLVSSIYLYSDVGAYAGELFMQRFPNLRVLSAKEVDLSIPPRLFRMQLPFFTSLEELQLDQCLFATLRTLLDLVWSSRNLTHLILQGCYVHKEGTYQADSASLVSACQNLYGCGKLTSLYLYGYPFVLYSSVPGNAFGSAVTSLDITYMVFTDAQSLTTFLQGSFPALRELYVAVDEFAFGRSSTQPAAPFLRAIALSLTTPSALRSLTLMASYKEAASHICCVALVGKPEVANADVPSLRALLPSLATLHIRVSAARSCRAYIIAALPSMKHVLNISRADRDDADDSAPAANTRRLVQGSRAFTVVPGGPSSGKCLRAMASIQRHMERWSGGDPPLLYRDARLYLERYRATETVPTPLSLRSRSLHASPCPQPFTRAYKDHGRRPSTKLSQ